jgi:hypothetical protein
MSWYPGKTIGVGDFGEFSGLDFILSDCRLCGQPARFLVPVQYTEEMYGRLEFCDACKFRHTVARAAGREKEFLEGLYRSEQQRETFLRQSKAW